jgi:hypothetical protein
MAELVTNIDQVTIAQTEVDQGLDLILRVRSLAKAGCGTSHTNHVSICVRVR